MHAVPSNRIAARPAGRPSLGWLRPSPGTELAGGLFILACIVGLRWWVAQSLPTYIWTRDSGSYFAPATSWLAGDPWVTSARRGPVYSGFMAGIFAAGGTLKTVGDLQAVLGAGTSLLTLAFARAWLGRRTFWPQLVCAFFYATYAMPIELERLIRNETLLVFFATVAFGAWFCALRAGSIPWIALSGLAAGLLHLLKGIFPIFPVIVLGLMVWCWRTRPRRAAALAGTFLLLFLLPLVSSKLYSRLSGTSRPPEPEDGQMFYGRTAQWTYLEPDGILPDIKRRIHDQAEGYAARYRRTGKLDNNEIVKRTVVPTLKTIIVDERGGTLVDVNRVSWRLGLEAVRHHPGAYLRQFGRDLFYLNFITAQRMKPFEPKGLNDAGRDAKIYAAAENRRDALNARLFNLPQFQSELGRALQPGSGLQSCSRFMIALGRLRLLSPVFLTTFLLPFLVWWTGGRHRLFWLGNLGLWCYYLVLLSTVGRPLDRYMMPMVPVMFWTITTAAALVWRHWQTRPAEVTTR